MKKSFITSGPAWYGALRQARKIIQIARMDDGGSISNQPNLFPVQIHLFFFDVFAL